jgi:hypothetical protein
MLLDNGSPAITVKMVPRWCSIGGAQSGGAQMALKRRPSGPAKIRAQNTTSRSTQAAYPQQNTPPRKSRVPQCYWYGWWGTKQFKVFFRERRCPRSSAVAETQVSAWFKRSTLPPPSSLRACRGAVTPWWTTIRRPTSRRCPPRLPICHRRIPVAIARCLHFGISMIPAHHTESNVPPAPQGRIAQRNSINQIWIVVRRSRTELSASDPRPCRRHIVGGDARRLAGGTSKQAAESHAGGGTTSPTAAGRPNHRRGAAAH